MLPDLEGFLQHNAEELCKSGLLQATKRTDMGDDYEVTTQPNNAAPHVCKAVHW